MVLVNLIQQRSEHYATKTTKFVLALMMLVVGLWAATDRLARGAQQRNPVRFSAVP
jgi:hypothetical protein